MESEIAGWLSVVFRFIHVLAAIMWIGNSLLFTWMELNLIPPRKEGEPQSLLGHLDMLHGGGVFHLQKRLIDPAAIPVPLHWFMWQSYTTWISGALLLVSVYYVHGGAALLDATKSSISGLGAIGLSVAGIIGWWLVYDMIWRSGFKEKPKVAVPVTLALIVAAAWLMNGYFNGRALYMQNVAMPSLAAGEPHDMKYGKQAKLRSMHNHYMTFPVLFMMLSAHFPQLTSAVHNVAILAVILVALMAVKHLMNSRYYFKHWLAGIFAIFALACVAIGALLATPSGDMEKAAAGEGARLFVSQGCAACHQPGASQLAPNLQGIFNSEQLLTDGSTAIADEAYLRAQIAKVADIEIAPDTAFLSAEERQVVNLLIEASDLMSEIYKRQRLPDYAETRATIAR